MILFGDGSLQQPETSGTGLCIDTYIYILVGQSNIGYVLNEFLNISDGALYSYPMLC
jgi:hypothetical protein